MPIFTRRNVTKAAASASGMNVGAKEIGNFTVYATSEARRRAMSIPTVTRARDLICGTIGTLRLEEYRWMWNGDDMEQVSQAPRSWLARLDKGVPNNFLMAWLTDDLLFFGRAFLYVTERYADGYPKNFTRMPSNMVTTLDQQANGGVYYGPSKEIEFNGMPVDYRDVVQFISPMQGLIYTTPKAIETAIKLEQSRYRNALTSIPSVVLRQTGGEPLSGQELADLAAAFDEARINNQTAAVNEFIEVKESFATPDKMMLNESIEYSSKDLCRAIGVPPYLLGIATGSYSYTNSESARQDLYIFGLKPLLGCIEETLSSDNVLPHGTGVRFDIDDYLESVTPDSDMPEVEENTQERLA
jgi:phage portal protein BeeE